MCFVLGVVAANPSLVAVTPSLIAVTPRRPTGLAPGPPGPQGPEGCRQELVMLPRLEARWRIFKELFLGGFHPHTSLWPLHLGVRERVRASDE